MSVSKPVYITQSHKTRAIVAIIAHQRQSICSSTILLVSATTYCEVLLQSPKQAGLQIGMIAF